MRYFLFIFSLSVLASCGGGGGSNDGPDNDEDTDTNRAPIASDDTTQINEDTVLSGFNVLANDSDPDGDTLSLVNAMPSIGDVDIASGEITYTPPANFFGEVTIDYTISDGSRQVSGTLTIEVLPINDAPVAVEDSTQINEDAVLSNFNVLSNDSDRDGDLLSLVSADPSVGDIDIIEEEITYTPPANFFGEVTVNYTISDGSLQAASTLTIEVLPINDAPIASDDTATVQQDSLNNVIDVLGNDSDVDDSELTIIQANANSGSVSTQGQNIVYSPDSSFIGSDTIEYTIEDSAGLSSAAEVDVLIEGGPVGGVIDARINPSRTSCASPCTVVFSADKTRAENMDEHQIWDELIYYWDFDTNETDQYGALYNQTYTYVSEGDTAHEIGGPMATKTFLCETGTCLYSVGMRAQNAVGEFDDAFVTITVRSESAAWSTANTVCVSNTLNTSADWTTFGKPCPAGATKQSDFPSIDDFDGRLILLRKGDVFTREVVTRMGQSNFKIGYFGDESDPRPEIDGMLDIGPSRISGTVELPTGSSSAHDDAEVVTFGWSENITIDGLRVGRVRMPMSYRHIGVHDLDMDRESHADGGVISISRNNTFCYTNATLSCSLVPFPHGTYISSTNVVGSAQALVNAQPLNVASIGCAMNNFVGIVDSQFRRAGEHNLRIMGWWRVNIMRSAWRGEHYSNGKQKLTTRGCVFQDIDAGRWASLGIENIFSDVDGAMRSDGHQEGTGNHVHVSRYMVIQGNEIGESTQLGARPGSTKIQTNVLTGDDELMQDYLVTKNIFVDTNTNTGVNDTVDIGLGGWHQTCVDNVYSPGNPCNDTPGSQFISVNPTPLTPPLAPGS